MTAFDPATWLRSFEAVGGWYVIPPKRDICVGWTIYGRTDHEIDEARRLFNIIAEDEGRREAVREVILAA